MSRELDEALNECLEALRSGRRTLEECLALYPRFRRELEPLLRLALDLSGVYREEEPAAAAKEVGRRRLLEAAFAGARPEPRPAPFLLRWRGLAALRLRLAPTGAWLRPALMGAGLLFLVFVGFSSYALATSGEALPGDWRYAVKRFTERARLTLTFDGDSKRSLRIDLVEERLEELEALAARSRPINEPVLRDLASTTQSVVKELDPASAPPEVLTRVSELTSRQKDVLEEVQPLVDEQAADDLQEALAVAEEGHEIAVMALAVAQEPEEETGGGGVLAPTPEASPSAPEGAAPSPDAEASATPAADATPAPASPTAEAEATVEPPKPTSVASTPVTEPTPELVLRREIVPLPEDTTGGLAWNLIVIDQFSVAVPAESGVTGEGWAVSSPLSRDPGEVLKGVVVAVLFEGGNAQVVVAVRVADGSVSLLTRSGVNLTPIDPAQVAELLAPETAQVVQHIIDSIQASPSPES